MVYRVACIGASRMASWFDDVMIERGALEWVPGAVASVCRALDTTELVAVCDLKPDLVDKLRARWGVPAGYTDWREMVERERPDIVAIVTSWGSTHAELAAAVAETGLVKGIYCEKPISATLAQADRVVDACRHHGVTYSCAHVSRWNARYRQAQAWIAGGAIGEVRSITCNGTGNLVHFGTHHADAMAGLADDADPEWAFGTVEPPPDLPPSDWRVSDPVGGGYVKLKNGVHLLLDGASPFPRSYVISGTTGKICVWNDQKELQLWRRSGATGATDLIAEPLMAPRQERSYALSQMAELVDVLEHGGQTSCNELAARRAMEIVLGLHMSHQQGGAKVAFPLADRSFGIDSK
jgi:predicted dehydrogenase